MKDKKLKLICNGIKIAIALVIIFFIVKDINLNQFWNYIISSNKSILFLYVLLIFLDRVLMAFKWNILLKTLELRLKLGDLVHLYLASTISGIFLPTTVGSDFFRIAYLSKMKNYSGSKVIASIVIERVLALLAAVLLALISLIFAFFVMKQKSDIFAISIQVVLLGIGLCCVVVTFFLLGFYHKWNLFNNLHDRLSKIKIYDKCVRLIQAIQIYRHNKHALLSFFLLTFLEQLVPTICIYLLVLALGVLQVNLVLIFVVVPVITLSIRLPISIDGWGIKEGLFVFLFGFINIGPEVALAVSTIDRFLPFAVSIPSFLYLYFSTNFRTLTTVQMKG